MSDTTIESTVAKATPNRTVRSQPSAVSYNAIGIRMLDLTIALSILIVTLPLLIVIGLIVRMQDGGRALFAHERIGCGGRSFKVLKVRSMVLDSDRRLAELLASDPFARAEWERDHKLKCDPRITRIGAFLRRSSLDELPQLFNVLKGEMSIVGPRPIVTAEISRYGRRFQSY